MSKPSQAKIFKDVDSLLIEITKDGNLNRHFILTSGGYAPIHRYHVYYLQEASKINLEQDPLHIAIVNGDGWLFRKKGFIPVSEDDRAGVVASISGVDYVLIWDDGSPTVCGAIELIKPNIFAKGGDRSDPTKIPEYESCQKVNCEVIFGVGGDFKGQSSTDILENIKKYLEEQFEEDELVEFKL